MDVISYRLKKALSDLAETINLPYKNGDVSLYVDVKEDKLKQTLQDIITKLSGDE